MCSTAEASDSVQVVVDAEGGVDVVFLLDLDRRIMKAFETGVLQVNV